MRPSLTSILSTVFICYVLNSLWTLYQLYSIPECLQNELCIPSYLKRNHAFKLLLYTSTKKDINNVAAAQSLMNWENFDYRKSFEKTINVDIPQSVINNGSLYIHAILLPKRAPSADLTQGLRNPYLSFASNLLTVYAIPEADAFQLLSNSKKEEKVVRKPKGNKPITHWKSILRINIIEDDDALPGRRIPSEIIKFINLSPENEYLPVLYIDSLSNRVQEQIPLNQSSTKMPLIINYSPMKFGKLRLWVQLENAVRQMSLLGFTPKDTDEVKGIFTGTNLFVLGVTFSVAAVHLLFDFLAFKNDVSFWRKKKSMVGLSTRTVIWRAVSQIIIFFYLMDENTSLLVLIPSGIGTIIEIWKVLKAVKVKISFSGLIPKFEFRAATKDEIQTEEFDAQSMKYLLYLLYPLCAIGAIYSLLYVPHKGWYSWTINSLVNGVYAFGFLFMLPQLFVNYKHKSVSHLPWKAFMYKAFNTFIDDLFAFIITMPTAHRIACFRDDLVFLVYLYQRWLYPVDKSRVNEFGESFEDDIKKNE